MISFYYVLVKIVCILITKLKNHFNFLQFCDTCSFDKVTSGFSVDDLYLLLRFLRIQKVELIFFNSFIKSYHSLHLILENINQRKITMLIDESYLRRFI